MGAGRGGQGQRGLCVLGGSGGAPESLDVVPGEKEAEIVYGGDL